ncbi:MAG TPA: UvrB/UvrC motif-containing protein [Candidatus Enterenecus merdae]|nr:UvrB/UvrC motif-containing protein [Candidatus Enterenecus merdae]
MPRDRGAAPGGAHKGFAKQNLGAQADSLRLRKIAKGAPHSTAVWEAAKMLEFELAAALRDQIIQLRGEKK